VKRKTDRDDALKLAQLAALEQLPTVHVPAPETRQRRALLKYRQSLITRRVAIQNHLRAIAQRQRRANRIDRLAAVQREGDALASVKVRRPRRGHIAQRRHHRRARRDRARRRR